MSRSPVRVRPQAPKAPAFLIRKCGGLFFALIFDQEKQTEKQFAGARAGIQKAAYSIRTAQHDLFFPGRAECGLDKLFHLGFGIESADGNLVAHSA